jgi:hypothetical protein
MEVQMRSKKSGTIRMDIRITFPGKNERRREKIYTFFEGHIDSENPLKKTFSLPLIHRSTRTLFPGKHTIAIIAGGITYWEGEFLLKLE